jgi:hypothetical protein
MKLYLTGKSKLWFRSARNPLRLFRSRRGFETRTTECYCIGRAILAVSWVFNNSSKENNAQCSIPMGATS